MSWGQIQLRNRINHKVLFTGEASPAPGGGSMPHAVLTKINGLVKDFDPDGGIDAAGALLFDPSPQDWLALHTYSVSAFAQAAGIAGVAASVHPTGDTSGLHFEAIQASSGVSGSGEPTWSADGSSKVEDNEVEWSPSVLKEWASETVFDASDMIVANGDAWVVDGGTSGVSEPDWASVPDYGGSIADGDMTWIRYSTAATWQPDHKYEVILQADRGNYWPRSVVPTVPAGYIFESENFLFTDAESGATEPDWAAESPGSQHYYIDGQLLWVESESDESLVLTGVVAPASAALLTVTSAAPISSTVVLIDTSTVASTYGTWAESAAGNTINRDGLDTTLNRGEQIPVQYANGEWQPLTQAS